MSTMQIVHWYQHTVTIWLALKPSLEKYRTTDQHIQNAHLYVEQPISVSALKGGPILIKDISFDFWLLVK